MARRRVFLLLAAACVVAAVAAVASAALRTRTQERAAARAVATARPAVDRLLGSGRPYVLVRDLDRAQGPRYGRLGIAPLGPDGAPGAVRVAGPACARVGFGGGRGLCLSPPGTNSFDVRILDARLRTVHTLHLAGVPSRARVSPDGRYGGITAFVTGHSYASAGQFSTAATIVDMATGRAIANLEQFRITHDGRPVTAIDVNYWGITFARDSDRFYATLATGGRTYLVQGSVRARRMHTIHANVECPSLSPDGTRIAYKKAVGHDPKVWHFYVLDLATGRETPLAEARPIDDQMAWLDDHRLLYGNDEAVWVVPADGTGPARRWLAAAGSPQVVR